MTPVAAMQSWVRQRVRVTSKVLNRLDGDEVQPLVQHN